MKPTYDVFNPDGNPSPKASGKVSEIRERIQQLYGELNSQLAKNPSEQPVITSPDNAYDILKPFLGCLDHEELWVVILDTRNRVMRLVKLYVGSVNSSQVRIGEVFRQAIIENAHTIIIAHNHPSGDPNPSPDDVALTRVVSQAGELLQIECLDHLIVGDGKYVSLKSRGLGFD